AAPARARGVDRTRVRHVRRRPRRRPPDARRRSGTRRRHGVAARLAAPRAPRPRRTSGGRRRGADARRGRPLHARSPRRPRAGGVSVELVLLRIAVALYLGSTVAALVGIAVRQDLPRTLLPRLLAGGFL